MNDKSIELREVVGFPGYFVASDGTVWTAKRKGGNDRTAGQRGELKPLATRFNRSGYVIVGLDVNGRNKTRPVHRLVLEAFSGPPPPNCEACHYPDPDKSNNAIENLRWDTHAENAKDRYRDRPPALEKRCRRCEETKPAADFYKDKRASDGLQGYCKSCHIRLAIATRDPEGKQVRNREFMRRRRAANPNYGR